MTLRGTLLVGLFAGLSALWVISGMAQDSPPEEGGKQAVQEACTLCHGLDYVARWKRTPSEWRDVVTNMVALGAPMKSTEELEAAIQYLSKIQGTTNPAPDAKSEAATININHASQKELETAFGLSASEAAAITRYRNRNGTIRGWDDLKKAPGIDFKKIESKKDRVAF